MITESKAHLKTFITDSIKQIVDGIKEAHGNGIHASCYTKVEFDLPISTYFDSEDDIGFLVVEKSENRIKFKVQLARVDGSLQDAYDGVYEINKDLTKKVKELEKKLSGTAEQFMAEYIEDNDVWKSYSQTYHDIRKIKQLVKQCRRFDYQNCSDIREIKEITDKYGL